MTYITIGPVCWGRAGGPDLAELLCLLECDPRYSRSNNIDLITYETEDDNAYVDLDGSIIAGQDFEVIELRRKKVPKLLVRNCKRIINKIKTY